MVKYITLNKNYVLKPDEGRTLMMASLVGRNQLIGIEDSFTNVIHPIYAMILSFIDGREYKQCINEAADELGVSIELIDGFVSKIIDNPFQVYIKSKDKISVFPPYTIVSLPYRKEDRRYSYEMFSYSTLDLRMKRHLTPSSITLMLNNICTTNCIYCYQDKSRMVKCQIPLERILQLIKEAYDLHVNNFDVIGGEFFLYEHWKDVLSELRKYGFNPYISTKMPLKEQDIKFLAELKIKDIQISIDSLIESNLKTSLGVKDGYISKMIKSIKLMEKYDIPMMFHTVLSRYNQSIDDMESVYNFIKRLKNTLDWHVVKGEASLYPKVPYDTIEIPDKELNKIVDYLSLLNEEKIIPIIFPQKINSETVKTMKISKEMQLKKFLSRSFCSGLFSSLYILPDGKVTMCEQLYWNKDFIVGNILSQSIIEVWNSEKAKSLYYIRQESIPKDSICSTCQYFEACRSIRQVCYREIIHKFGKEKWYYPDVNCPFNTNFK